VTAIAIVAILGIRDETDVSVSFVFMASYLRRPPPPRDPMLAEPRALLARAALAVGRLLDAPPNALPLRLDELGTLRLPTRSAPPALRLDPPSPVVPADGRFAPALPVRLALPGDPVLVDGLFRWAADCRFATESPRAVPPNLFAVARSPYGAAPRC
jgi:hypothetical protein